MESRHTLLLTAADESLHHGRDNDKSYTRRMWSIYFLYAMGNLMIVCVVNIAYVVVVLYTSRSIIITAQILLSLFKIIWNNGISPIMLNWIVRYLSITTINAQSTLFFIQFVISIFNNIIIPCVMVMIISPNCFYNVFQKESDVVSSFQYDQCDVLDTNGECDSYITTTSSTSYSPPFTYSYQCSSAFITYYSPVFLLVCVISTFIVTFIQICWIKWKMPNIFLSSLFYPSSDVRTLTIPVVMDIGEIFKRLVFALTFVGLIMTFGAVYPPLAVAFFITILSQSYYHHIVIGRYICIATNLDILEDNLKVQPLLSTIEKCGWFLLYVSCSFYTLFLVDILGDDVGFYQAYWVLIVMPCIPVCIHSSYVLIEWIIAYRRRSQARRTASDAAIQLNPLVRFDATNFNRDSSIIDIQVDDRYSESIKI